MKGERKRGERGGERDERGERNERGGTGLGTFRRLKVSF